MLTYITPFENVAKCKMRHGCKPNESCNQIWNGRIPVQDKNRFITETLSIQSTQSY